MCCIRKARPYSSLEPRREFLKSSVSVQTWGLFVIRWMEVATGKWVRLNAATPTMNNSYKKSSEFKDYPFLTPDEFSEACHHLERRYIQAELGPLRRQWKLRVNRALIMAFTPAAEYSTYIQIVKPLQVNTDDD